MKITSRSFGTHDGSFHADEVTACALLLLFDLIDEEKVVRSRDPQLLEGCEYVCDVGGTYAPEKKRFDHHQRDYDGEFSSAGMVLSYLKEAKIVDEGLYNYLRGTLVRGVDAHDMGRLSLPAGVCSFSHIISNFVPISYDASEKEQNAAFREAFNFTLSHLQRSKARYLYALSCRELVKKAMEKGKECLVFERAIPWLESFFELGGRNHPAVYVIMPAGQHWKLRAIPPSLEERMQVRRALPADWAGLRDEELKKRSGIDGAIFCHKERFISIWLTKLDAMKALEKALQ